MGILRVLSRRGDDRVTWQALQVETEDLEARAAVLEAERIFRLQQKRGATAFRVEKGQAPVRVDKFDPTAQEIIMVPRVVGG
ncbi:MAG: hypothetical protein ACLQUY_24260 [Ktedonobacterales bacterium]